MGETLAASEAYLELSQRPGMGEPMVRILRVALDDGRVLLIARSSLPRAAWLVPSLPPPPAGWAVRRWLFLAGGESLGLGLPVFPDLFLGRAGCVAGGAPAHPASSFSAGSSGLARTAGSPRGCLRAR